MSRAALTCAVLFTISSARAWAQRIEVSPFAGVTVSEDFDLSGGGSGYRISDVEDGLAYGVMADVAADENDRFGFLWSRVETRFRSGSGGFFGQPGPSLDVVIDQYQATFIHDWGDARDRIRPFLYGGLGATHFGSPGLDGETRFSWSLGGGAKVFVSGHIGFRFQGRWAATWVSGSSASFCDPYGFCFLAIDAELFHQFEFTTGVVLRF